jgi:hypothetical protein
MDRAGPVCGPTVRTVSNKLAVHAKERARAISNTYCMYLFCMYPLTFVNWNLDMSAETQPTLVKDIEADPVQAERAVQGVVVVIHAE